MSPDHKQIRHILYCAFVLALPFGPFLPNLFMGFIIAYGLWVYLARPRPFSKWDGLLFFALNGFVLFHFISLFWTSNLALGLEKALLLAVIPGLYLAISVQQRPSWKEAGELIGLFASSVAVLSVLSFVAAIHKYGWGIGSITQDYLATALINFHYLGFSLYAGTAFALGLYMRIFRPDSLSKGYRMGLMVILPILLATLLMLSSRTTIVVTLMLSAGILIAGRNRISPKARWLFPGLMGIVALIIVSNKVLVEKFMEAVNYGNHYEVTEVWGGRGFRELIWDCAGHTILENPWVGVGCGDQQEVLQYCYRTHRYQPLLYKGNNFNAHNLFLQTAIATGAIGVLLLAMAILYPVLLLRKQKAGLYYIFMLMIFLTGITESHFNRNAVVLLFAFFSTYLLYLHLDDESTANT